MKIFAIVSDLQSALARAVSTIHSACDALESDLGHAVQTVYPGAIPVCKPAAPALTTVSSVPALVGAVELPAEAPTSKPTSKRAK